jgi:hypothetical protein
MTHGVHGSSLGGHDLRMNAYWASTPPDYGVFHGLGEAILRHSQKLVRAIPGGLAVLSSGAISWAKLAQSTMLEKKGRAARPSTSVSPTGSSPISRAAFWRQARACRRIPILPIASMSRRRQSASPTSRRNNSVSQLPSRPWHFRAAAHHRVGRPFHARRRQPDDHRSIDHPGRL